MTTKGKRRVAMQRRIKYKRKAKKMTVEAIASKDPKHIYSVAYEISWYHNKYNHHHIAELEDAIIATNDTLWIKSFSKLRQANTERLLTVAALLGDIETGAD